MKRKIRGWQVTGIIISIVGMALFSGAYIGPAFLDDSASRQNFNRSYEAAGSETIAVVNLDEGVGTEIGRQNYSNAIIDELDESYKLVPFQVAEDGINAGSYDAVVCFPSNFSEKASAIDSINPDQIALEYEIYDKLPSHQKVSLDEKLTSLQSKTSATLSYMYVYSIYSELHNAQDQAKKIFKNDKQDLKKANDIKSYDFAASIDMSDIPQININLKKINFNKHVNTMKNISNNIDNIYTSNYAKSKARYKEMIEGLEKKETVVSTNSDEFKDTIETWQSDYDSWYSAAADAYTTYSDFINNPNYEETDLNKKITDYNNSIESLSNYTKYTNLTNPGSALNNFYKDNTGAYNKYMNEVEKIPAIIKTFEKNKTKTYRYEYDGKEYDTPVSLGGILASTGYNLNEINEKKLTDSIKEVEAYGEVLTKLLPSSNWKNVIDGKTDTQIADGIKQNYNVTSSDRSILVPISSPPAMSEDVIDSKKLPNEIKDYLSLANDYNPNSYLGGEVTESSKTIVNNYNNDIFRIKTRFENAQSKDVKETNASHSTLNKHISTIRDSVEKANDKEAKDIDQALSNFKSVKKTSLDKNAKLVGSFSEKMANTKEENSVNEDVVEFVSDPVALAATPVREMDNEGGLPKIPLIGFLASVLLLAGVSISILLTKKGGR